MLEKVYRVEFMRYTNCNRDTVSNGAEDVKDRRYLSVDLEPFLVKESELDEYRAWGGGFRSIEFVGNMEVCANCRK